MIFLIDHNLNGHAMIFFGSIANQGWLDIIPMRFVTFAQMELPIHHIFLSMSLGTKKFLTRHKNLERSLLLDQ